MIYNEDFASPGRSYGANDEIKSPGKSEYQQDASPSKSEKSNSSASNTNSLTKKRSDTEKIKFGALR